MNITTFAAIYIGSYEVSLKIMEISAKQGIREIDYIRSRIGLGREIYNNGSVGTEMMESLSDVLEEYVKIMKSYRVKDYRAYAGAMVRDARNLPFLGEQIRMKTGINVEVLSNSEKRFVNYQSVAAITQRLTHSSRQCHYILALFKCPLDSNKASALFLCLYYYYLVSKSTDYSVSLWEMPANCFFTRLIL